MGQSNKNYKSGHMVKFNLCFNIVHCISVMVLMITFVVLSQAFPDVFKL